MELVQIKLGLHGRKSNSLGLIFIIVTMITLLAIRDIGEVNVNKYFFLVFLGIMCFLIPIEDVTCLIAFLMPLYVGLPGNYITMILLARFLFENAKLRIRLSTLFCCVLAGLFAVADAFRTGNLGISQLMFFPGMILVMFMFSLKVQVEKSKFVLSYIMGVATLGIIMFIATLQLCTFEEMLTVPNMRIGFPLWNAKYGAIILNVDPNFYGLFCITSISAGMPVLIEQRNKRSITLGIIIGLGVCLAIALIGLSRSFFISLILWVFIYFLSIKNIKPLLIFLIVILSVVLLLEVFGSNVLDALFGRFNDSSMEGGNGRTDLIVKCGRLWMKNPFTILFGMGIFNCNVHCMPLQILFGGGFVFTILYLAFIFSLMKYRKVHMVSEILQRYIPIITALIMASSIPGLALVNIVFPIMFVMMAINR